MLEHIEAALLPLLLIVTNVPSSGCMTVLFVKVYVGAEQSNALPGFEYSSSSSKSLSPYDSNLLFKMQHCSTFIGSNVWNRCYMRRS